MKPSNFTEKVLSSKLLYDGRAVRLRLDQVRLPTGRNTSREIIEHPGSVGILPLLPRNRVILIRQYRHAIGRTIWEIPAGTIEPGEKPEECASRELEEETGYRAGTLEPFFDCYAAPGYSMELMHLFMARGLKLTGKRPEEDEIISVESMTSDRAFRMIRSGQIRDAKTICALSRFRASRRR